MPLTPAVKGSEVTDGAGCAFANQIRIALSRLLGQMQQLQASALQSKGWFFY
jgi:hypothetical protein